MRSPVPEEPRPRGLAAIPELVRAPLVPTAAADSFAGLSVAALSRGLSPSAGEILGTALTSALIYAAGMVANDIFDLPRDRRTAPGRPLPSGRVALPAAAALAAVLASAATLSGALLGAGMWTLALLGLVLLYDVGGKRIPGIGSLLMGSCRAANFLLGAVVLLGAEPALEDSSVLLGAGVLGLYILAVTGVSRLEDRPFEPGALRLRALAALLAPLVLIVSRPGDPFLWAHLALLEALLVRALLRASRGSGRAHPAEAFVARSLGALVLVDAALVLALAPPGGDRFGPVLALYALWILTGLWRGRSKRGRDPL